MEVTTSLFASVRDFPQIINSDPVEYNGLSGPDMWQILFCVAAAVAHAHPALSTDPGFQLEMLDASFSRLV